jgi:deoxycytidine triphosphate deaminase/intein/homing endonuclease
MPAMILSDRELRAEIESGRLVIEPFDPDAIQPSSIDLRVGHQFRVFANHRYPVIDVRETMSDLTEVVEATEEEPFILHPGEFVLGSTLEKVSLPDDRVARLEGKSSLGRLGLLIHSSLPGDETVLFSDGKALTQRPIGDIVRKRLEGQIVGFDPETFATDFFDITGWHESNPDRIFEVVLASGRRVRLTGGHTLFSLDRNGEIRKLRVHELVAGTKVAIAGNIPEPVARPVYIDVLSLAPENIYRSLVCGGPSVAAAFDEYSETLASLLADIGIAHHGYYRRRRQLPLEVAAQMPQISLGPDDWLAVRGGRHHVPALIEVDEALAWLLGLYVAEGSRREGQFTISNTDPAILDRAQAVLAELGLPVFRNQGWAITCCSGLMSLLIDWLGCGGYAREKRLPEGALGWPLPLLEALLDGFIDGDGSIESTRISLWTSSQALVGDLLLLCCQLGRRASACLRERDHGSLWQISVPHREHKLLTSLPLPDELLVEARLQAGLDQKSAAVAAGFRYPTQLNNIEKRRWPAIRTSTLRRLRGAFPGAQRSTLAKIDRLLDGDLKWDSVVEVLDTGTVEPVFDLEVRPNGRRIENFLAGHGGVFVSNTAGFVDAGFTGQLTLELSNVANLPIAIYPGMRVGQLCLFQMTSPAERPYGSDEAGSKYQGQQGPTASRYYKNFEKP